MLRDEWFMKLLQPKSVTAANPAVCNFHARRGWRNLSCNKQDLEKHLFGQILRYSCTMNTKGEHSENPPPSNSRGHSENGRNRTKALGGPHTDALDQTKTWTCFPSFLRVYIRVHVRILHLNRDTSSSGSVKCLKKRYSSRHTPVRLHGRSR